MALQTREPTGAVPWPLILLEGPEKCGKTWLCAEFSASERIGQMYWIDIGEGSGDEYGAIPGARYRIVIHDGTFPSILTSVEDVRAEARRAADAGEAPVVLTIDTGTAEWDLLKDWATNRARGSRKNRKILEEDPNAEITVSTNYWNDANARHYKLMKLLMTFPGIVLITARGKQVAVIGSDGQPVEGKKDYRVEGHKGLGYDVSCWVRMSREGPAIVVGSRSVHSGIRPGRDEPQKLSDDWSLEWLIFEALKCDPKTAHVRDLVVGKAERTPEQIRDEAIDTATGFERIRELYTEAKRDLAVIVPNEAGEDEQLGDLLIRLGKARAAATSKADQNTHTRMHVLWQQAGFGNDRDGRLAFTSEIVGRELATSADLTPAEAEQVIARLTGYIANNTPPAEPEGEAQ